MSRPDFNEDFVDLLRALISGVSFDEAWSSKLDVEIVGIKVSVLGLEALLKNKRATGRPKDVVDADMVDKHKRRKE